MNHQEQVNHQEQGLGFTTASSVSQNLQQNLFRNPSARTFSRGTTPTTPAHQEGGSVPLPHQEDDETDPLIVGDDGQETPLLL
ncbi:unnamed protein product, partial [Amoebophrya sp. A25]|eukprot:GSA25T00026170001.1